MFTGLVEDKGIVRRLHVFGNTTDITVESEKIAEDAKLGDSIAINGCCLTVVAIDHRLLTFQAGRETLSRTNLGQLRAGSHVNLERSIKSGDRMGGHFVTGHVDGLASIEKCSIDGDWAEFWFRLDPVLTQQMASKGSIAVDGISLTLVEVDNERFSVALIPHTLQVTTLGEKHVGDTVNIETDLLAKYVQRQIGDAPLKF